MNQKPNHWQVLGRMLSDGTNSGASRIRTDSSSMVPFPERDVVGDQEPAPFDKEKNVPRLPDRLLSSADFRAATGFMRERNRTVMGSPRGVNPDLEVIAQNVRRKIYEEYQSSDNAEPGDETKV